MLTEVPGSARAVVPLLTGAPGSAGKAVGSLTEVPGSARGAVGSPSEVTRSARGAVLLLTKVHGSARGAVLLLTKVPGSARGAVLLLTEVSGSARRVFLSRRHAPGPARWVVTALTLACGRARGGPRGSRSRLESLRGCRTQRRPAALRWQATRPNGATRPQPSGPCILQRRRTDPRGERLYGPFGARPWRRRDGLAWIVCQLGRRREAAGFRVRPEPLSVMMTG